MVTSSAVVGSSAISSLGLQDKRHRDHHPLLLPARQLVWVGVELAARDRECRLRRTARSSAAGPRPWTLSGAGWIASITWLPTVKTGFSEVIGSWKIMLMSLPRICRIAGSGKLDQIFSQESDGPGLNLGRGGQQPHDRQRRDRLARAGFAHDAQRLPFVDGERDPFNGFDRLLFRMKVGAKVVDANNRLRHVECQSTVRLGVEGKRLGGGAGAILWQCVGKTMPFAFDG